MPRRKAPSKRRVKARFHAGRPVPLQDLARNRLNLWISHQDFSLDQHDLMVRKVVRGSNG